MTNAAVFQRITERLLKVEDEFAQEFADEFERRVKTRTPVDTGRLRSGWETNVTADEITISNDVEYAGFVEDGTEHMSGAHMLKTTQSEFHEIARLASNRIKK